MARIQFLIVPILAALLLLGGVIAPAMAHEAGPVDTAPLAAVFSNEAATIGQSHIPSYEIAYTLAQTTVIPTLAIQADVMSSQMMTGANIIVGAIGVVIFLLIGMKLGGVIIRAISSAIDGLRI